MVGRLLGKPKQVTPITSEYFIIDVPALKLPFSLQLNQAELHQIKGNRIGLLANPNIYYLKTRKALVFLKKNKVS